MKNFLKHNRLIFLFIILYFLIFSLYACARHYTFQTQTWDLAAFEQSFWNSLHGKFMYNTFEQQNHFSIHFSPFLILLLPFYAIYQSPYTLLIIQTFALALGALPLYLLATKLLNQKWAYLITILYFLYPSLHWVNLFDFHEVSFAVPLILATFYFLEIKKFGLATLFLALTASTAENMIIAVFFIGVYLFFFKNKKYGAAVTIISLIYFILVAKVIMPAFGGGVVRLDRYAQFGSTAPEIIKNVIIKPTLTLKTVFTSPKMFYLFKLFLPVAFLTLIAWEVIILLVPGLLQNLLTNFEFQFANFYQYDSIIIPFIFIGVVLGIKKLAQKKINEKILFNFILIAALIGFFWNSPLSPINFPLAKFKNERIKDFKNIVKIIPDDASVSAYTNFVPHLTHREHIYMMGFEPFLVDYVIIDSLDIFGFPSQENFNAYLEKYRQTKNYTMLTIDDRYYILKNKSAPDLKNP